MIIDSHCHIHYAIQNIHDETLQKETIEKILLNCQKNSVLFLLNVATNGNDSANFIKKHFTLQNKKIFKFNKNNKLVDEIKIGYSVGFHPCENIEINIEELDAIAGEAMAIGETGIDLFHKNVPIEIQISNFEKQILVARKHNLPVIVHCRDGEAHVIEMIKKYSKVRYILHCFAGNSEFLEALLPYKTLFSFSALVTYKNTEAIQKAVAIAPLDRIILETDSPFLIPYNHRKQGHKANEPSFIVENLQKVAEIKNISVEDLQKFSTENFLKFMELEL